MRRVFHVDIYGQKVPVYLKDGLLKEHGTYGECEFDTKTEKIIIDSSLNQKKFIHTLAHEMIHFTFYRLNIQLTHEQEEQLCENVIIPLLENFQVSLPPRLLAKLAS